MPECEESAEIVTMRKIVEVLKTSFPRRVKWKPSSPASEGGLNLHTAKYELSNGTIWEIDRLLNELED